MEITNPILTHLGESETPVKVRPWGFVRGKVFSTQELREMYENRQ